MSDSEAANEESSQQRPLPVAHSDSPALVIDIDFGTTYSGISWALTAAPNNIYLIKSWPGMDGRSFEKVPSEIHYQRNSRVDEEDFKFEWGFKANKEEDRIKWIKLLLDPSQNAKVEGLSHFTDRALQRIPEGMTACDVLVDFLSALHDHLKYEIGRKFGQDFFEVMPMQYVFTVPAIWSDKAKALTQKAAKAAGFLSSDSDDLLLVPEPEAAALCCLKTIQPNNIKDLIAYEILRLSPTMEVREAVVGDGTASDPSDDQSLFYTTNVGRAFIGDLCGSVIINTLFETVLMKNIGRDTFAKLKPGCRQLALNYFDENVKRNFSDDEDREAFPIPLPGVPDNPDAGILDGFFILTRDDLREIFRPVLERIEKFIKSQCKSIQDGGWNAAGIRPVGGFGSSQYFLKYFKAWAEENGNMKVLQPPDAWSSIVRGAVMAGLQHDKDVVKTRLARRYYGTSFQELFVQGLHPEEYKIWSPYQKQWFCDKRMRWFIQKGDQIAEHNPLEHGFYTEFTSSVFESPWLRNSHATLYAYDGDAPPSFTDSPGVYKVTEMTTDLSKAPDSSWLKRNYGEEEDVMTLDYDLRMILRGAMLSFELRCEGKQYGYVTTKFE